MRGGNVKIKRSELGFFLLFFSHFYFIFELFLFFLFLELRVRIKSVNTRRKAWKDNIVQCRQYMLALRHTHNSLG